MKKLILITSLIILLLTACISSNDETDKGLIADIYRSIEDAFKDKNTDKIMSYYHSDFKHNGHSTETLHTLVWKLRTTLYNNIRIEVVYIEITDPFATAELKIYYDNSVIPIIAPTIDGDLSYFYYDNGKWQLFGNQND